MVMTHSKPTVSLNFFEWLFQGNVCCPCWSLVTHLSDLCGCSGGGWQSYLDIQQGSFLGLLGYIDHLGCFHGCHTIHCFSSGEKIACGHWSIWMRESDSLITTLHLAKENYCHSTCVTTCFANTTTMESSYLVTWQMTTLSLTEL